jgi:hypothetical protein
LDCGGPRRFAFPQLAISEGMSACVEARPANHGHDHHGKTLTIKGRQVRFYVHQPAGAGSYRLRVVIEGAASGKLFATSRPMAIP